MYNEGIRLRDFKIDATFINWCSEKNWRLTRLYTEYFLIFINYTDISYIYKYKIIYVYNL